MAKPIRTMDEIIGHDGIVNYFKKCKSKDIYPNVMIFHGNPGLGKTAMAKLVAIDIVTKRESAESISKIIHTVVDESRDTDAIRLFNMSNLRDQSAIDDVKSNMHLSFTESRRKVLILDEAHGMSKEAQDSILVELEKMPDGLFIILCTTELGVLRDSILSRSKCTILFKDLAARDIRRLISDEIEHKHLSFQMQKSSIVAILAQWCGNQPRKAYNFLEGFEYGQSVSNEDIRVFVDLDVASQVIEVVKHLYGSMSMGISMIDGCSIDTSFVDTLIEVCNICLGAKATMIKNSDCTFILDFMKGREVGNLVRFTAEVCRLRYPRKREVISAFMRCHESYEQFIKPENKTEDKIRSEDLLTMQQERPQEILLNSSNKNIKAKSIADLFSDGMEFE